MSVVNERDSYGASQMQAGGENESETDSMDQEMEEKSGPSCAMIIIGVVVVVLIIAIIVVACLFCCKKTDDAGTPGAETGGKGGKEVDPKTPKTPDAPKPVPTPTPEKKTCDDGQPVDKDGNCPGGKPPHPTPSPAPQPEEKKSAIAKMIEWVSNNKVLTTSMILATAGATMAGVGGGLATFAMYRKNNRPNGAMGADSCPQAPFMIDGWTLCDFQLYIGWYKSDVMEVLMLDHPKKHALKELYERFKKTHIPSRANGKEVDYPVANQRLMDKFFVSQFFIQPYTVLGDFRTEIYTQTMPFATSWNTFGQNMNQMAQLACDQDAAGPLYMKLAELKENKLVATNIKLDTADPSEMVAAYHRHFVNKFMEETPTLSLMDAHKAAAALIYVVNAGNGYQPGGNVHLGEKGREEDLMQNTDALRDWHSYCGNAKGDMSPGLVCDSTVPGDNWYLGDATLNGPRNIENMMDATQQGYRFGFPKFKSGEAEGTVDCHAIDSKINDKDGESWKEGCSQAGDYPRYADVALTKNVRLVRNDHKKQEVIIPSYTVKEQLPIEFNIVHAGVPRWYDVKGGYITQKRYDAWYNQQAPTLGDALKEQWSTMFTTVLGTHAANLAAANSPFAPLQKAGAKTVPKPVFIVHRPESHGISPRLNREAINAFSKSWPAAGTCDNIEGRQGLDFVDLVIRQDQEVAWARGKFGPKRRTQEEIPGTTVDITNKLNHDGSKILEGLQGMKVTWG